MREPSLSKKLFHVKPNNNFFIKKIKKNSKKININIGNILVSAFTSFERAVKFWVIFAASFLYLNNKLNYTLNLVLK